jgi:LysM repeat protein
MKIISWIKAVCTLFVMLITCGPLFSQVNVERSNDKVTISGTAYYIHQVRKGETSYSISRAYNITVEELTKENPPAVYGIKEGQSLRIPVKELAQPKTDNTVSDGKQRDESKFIYHKLNPGETVYYLSKAYGVSENEIISSNPGIEINKLPVGSEIVVPRRDFMTERQKFETTEKEYTFHKVVKGESLSSIADIYGISVRELRKENRNLRFPQVGDYVRIPGVKSSELPTIAEIMPDSAIIVLESTPVTERPAGYTPITDLKGTYNVAVLLPFYLKENSKRIDIDSSKSVKGKKQYRQTRLPEEWIYPRSYDFVEMYEGILLAADTLRSLGMNINVSPFDIRSDTLALSKLLLSGKLAEMDLIIGPVYSYNLAKVAAYARGLNIPVVSPVPLYNNDALYGNPTLFLASSSLEIAQNAIVKQISEYPYNNIVFIHADSLGTDSDVGKFKNSIFKELNYKLPYEEIKFKEITFYSRSMFGNDSINRLSQALSISTNNIVIIASEDPPVISETLQDIHGLSRKFNVKVFGYPVLRELDNLDPKYLYEMNMLIYSSNWIDYSKDDVKQFNSDFRRKFLTEPTEKSYAWQGYDIVYYFLSGLAVHGDNFILNPQIHFPDLLQTQYNFVRRASGDGFENQKLFLVRYTKDYDVKLVEEAIIPQIE